MKINSMEWWNEEFGSRRWETGIDGNEQTKLFAEIAYSLLSPTIKANIYINNNYLDFGCAYGQGIEYFLKKIAPENDIDPYFCGVDFAEEAIIQAKLQYENYQFFIDIDSACKQIQKKCFDVIYCSNVLEHYEKPGVIFNQLIENSCNYVIILVPYQQRIEGSHVYTFTKENLENLIYLYPEWNIVQQTEIGKIDKLYSPVPQILTVYKKIF